MSAPPTARRQGLRKSSGSPAFASATLNLCKNLRRQVVGMTVDPAPGHANGMDPSPCPHCGGSGLLRLDSQRFRTCLSCLGKGLIVPRGAAISTVQLPTLQAAALLSASASVAAAR